LREGQVSAGAPGCLADVVPLTDNGSDGLGNVGGTGGGERRLQHHVRVVPIVKCAENFADHPVDTVCGHNRVDNRGIRLLAAKHAGRDDVGDGV
jgi:hypothetical protein